MKLGNQSLLVYSVPCSMTQYVSIAMSLFVKSVIWDECIHGGGSTGDSTLHCSPAFMWHRLYVVNNLWGWQLTGRNSPVFLLSNGVQVPLVSGKTVVREWNDVPRLCLLNIFSVLTDSIVSYVEQHQMVYGRKRLPYVPPLCNQFEHL